MDKNKDNGKQSIEQLLKDNPNDPRIGQGFNDARGDFNESEEDSDFKNRNNHLGPEQKKIRDPDISVVRMLETSTPDKDLRQKKEELHD